MLQAILLSMLAAEVIFYIWLGNFLSARGVGGAAIVAIIVLIALLWRLSHALTSFVVTSAWRWRDGRVLPWGNSMAALANECAARAICFNWSQPFANFAIGREPTGASNKVPILLVHGYVCNSGLWISFRRRLAAAGLGPIYTVTLAPLFGGIDVLVPPLAARIEAICAETGAKKIMIVAHSMGGLVLRAYLAETASSRVAKLVTMGSPHHGTQLTRLGFDRNAGQMGERSEWLDTLEDIEAANDSHPSTLSIYTLNDDIVYPPESSVLQWAENVPVSAIGHMGLVFSEAVANRVIRFLR